MSRARTEGDERNVVVEPGQAPQEAARIPKRGRGRPRRETPVAESGPYDPSDLPLTRRVEEERRHIRSVCVEREGLYKLCDSLQVVGLPTRRFLEEATRLSRSLPVWEAELRRMEAALVDCSRGSGSAEGLLQTEWLREERSMTHGYRSGNLGCGDPREDAAEKMRVHRERRRRELDKLPRLPRPERHAFTTEEAALCILREAEWRRLELESLSDEWADGDRGKGRLERMRKLLGDLSALGWSEEMVSRYEKLADCKMILEEAKIQGIRLSGGGKR